MRSRKGENFLGPGQLFAKITMSMANTSRRFQRWEGREPKTWDWQEMQENRTCKHLQIISRNIGPKDRRFRRHRLYVSSLYLNSKPASSTRPIHRPSHIPTHTDNAEKHNLEEEPSPASPLLVTTGIVWLTLHLRCLSRLSVLALVRTSIWRRSYMEIVTRHTDQIMVV